jgi:O-acetyl-ADP-ribose deacetylase (regulator of RNase III)
MITKYIVGDITETELKYIAHGVNCQNKMGSGVAKALYEKFPDVKKSYHEYFKGKVLGKKHLGILQYSYSDDETKVIINCFTQENYGYDGNRYVNYKAIVDCFKLLRDGSKGRILAIPKIGCGLAGGDWNFVEQLINDTVGDDLEIWVYTLDKI